MIAEFDGVMLTRDLPECGLKEGDIGVVVLQHNSGSAFEVDFVTEDGGSAALLTLSPPDIEPINAIVREDRPYRSTTIPHGRKLTPAT